VDPVLGETGICDWSGFYNRQYVCIWLTLQHFPEGIKHEVCFSLSVVAVVSGLVSFT